MVSIGCFKAGGGGTGISIYTYSGGIGWDVMTKTDTAGQPMDVHAALKQVVADYDKLQQQYVHVVETGNSFIKIIDLLIAQHAVMREALLDMAEDDVVEAMDALDRVLEMQERFDRGKGNETPMMRFLACMLRNPEVTKDMLKGW